jgi:hypothetical protein
MALAPVATVAACGSILTAVKSGWELSRMIKKKDLEKRLDKEARTVVRDLQNAYLDGLMSERSFEKWYDRIVGALAEKDGEYLSPFLVVAPRAFSTGLTFSTQAWSFARSSSTLILSGRRRIA